jgi:hypothetical protein
MPDSNWKDAAMKHAAILPVMLCALAALVCSRAANAAEAGTSIVKNADAVTYSTDQDCRRRRRPTEATLEASAGGRRIGGYSYRSSDVVNTYGVSPPPYAGVKQSPGGPFDSDFFFDSGLQRGNNAPYPR